ncbi:nucleoside-diphosphate kinase [Streptomyces sp. NPDC007808]|uniref:nucleoside-diphosphate kinase n=1 Tax=Streptomyces sp. NPDC007808 TaxID=3364779 RepID=UPI0036B540A2
MPYSAIGAGALDPLTRDPRKAEAYRLDPYMREALDSLAPMPDPGVLDRHTFVVLKPDAVAGRRCELILGILRSEGWHPVAATTVRFDPLLVRELWRYQFNAASAQRIAVVDPLLSTGRSLLVLLEDRDRPAWLPASARLTAAKGAAEPSAARSTDLRTRIGRVNGLYNFMHTADEPADVARELQLFSYQAGWDWCAGPLFGTAAPGATDPRETVTRLLAEVEAEIPAHDLDVDASLGRLAAQQGPWGACARDWPEPGHVEEWLGVLRRAPLPPGSARWDVLTVLTSWIDCNEAGVRPIIATGTADAWRASAGEPTREATYA